MYLIAHKVRGEPAFDIAEPMQVGDETWWVIPTSGHRAYPYWTSKLEDWDVWEIWEKQMPSMPLDLRDHYQVLNALNAPSRQSTSRTTEIDLDDLEV